MKLENFSMQDLLLSVSMRARTAIFASRSPDGKAQTSSESGQNSLTGALLNGSEMSLSPHTPG